MRLHDRVRDLKAVMDLSYGAKPDVALKKKAVKIQNSPNVLTALADFRRVLVGKWYAPF